MSNAENAAEPDPNAEPAPTPNAEPAPNAEPVAETPEDAQRQIAQTRERLGETVQELAQKADVKAQAQQRVQEGKDEVRARVDGLKDKALQVGSRVQEVTPEQARQAAGQLAQRARERPAPWAAGGGLAVGVLLGWALSGRRRG